VKEPFEFFHKIPSGYIVDTSPKNKGGSFKKYPLGIVLGTFESAHHLPAGYELGELMGTF